MRLVNFMMGPLSMSLRELCIHEIINQSLHSLCRGDTIAIELVFLLNLVTLPQQVFIEIGSNLVSHCEQRLKY
jgi:hypothetical protein